MRSMFDRPEDEPHGTPTPLDISVAKSARVYDYFLHGKDNFAADRVVGDQILARFPQARQVAMANRRFAARTARCILEAGVRQIVDIGTGLPSPPSVYQVAAEVAPRALVVGVDNDPIVLAHDRALLPDFGGCPRVVEGDVTDAAQVLERTSDAGVDYSQPVGVIIAAVLHFIPGDLSDLLAEYRAHMAPGSYLVISQVTSDNTDPQEIAAGEAIYAEGKVTLQFRPGDVIENLFGDWVLADPGLVDVHLWRPEIEQDATPIRIIGGMARHPGGRMP